MHRPERGGRRSQKRPSITDRRSRAPAASIERDASDPMAVQSSAGRIKSDTADIADPLTAGRVRRDSSRNAVWRRCRSVSGRPPRRPRSGAKTPSSAKPTAAQRSWSRRLRPGEAQIGFHAAQRVGRQAGAFFESEADFVVPVKFVRGKGYQPSIERRRGVADAPSLKSVASSLKRVASRVRPLTISRSPKLSGPSATCGPPPACSCDRRRAPIQTGCRQSTSPRR